MMLYGNRAQAVQYAMRRIGFEIREAPAVNPQLFLDLKAAIGRTRKTVQRVQLVDLVDSLIDGGFFKTPRDLAAVRAALAQMGHHYPITTLSGAMLRKVRRRELRRLKQDKRWVYTGASV